MLCRLAYVMKKEEDGHEVNVTELMFTTTTLFGLSPAMLLHSQSTKPSTIFIIAKVHPSGNHIIKPQRRPLALAAKSRRNKRVITAINRIVPAMLAIISSLYICKLHPRRIRVPRSILIHVGLADVVPWAGVDSRDTMRRDVQRAPHRGAALATCEEEAFEIAKGVLVVHCYASLAGGAVGCLRNADFLDVVALYWVLGNKA